MRRSIIFKVSLSIMIILSGLTVKPPSDVRADANSNNVVFLPLVSNTHNPANIPETGGSLPTLDQFIQQSYTGNIQWSGVYVANKFAFKIIQQPENLFEFISSVENEVTQFMLAVPQVVGLLAHNHLAGKSFFDLEDGDLIYLINGVGEFKEYRISASASLQAIVPSSPTTMFKDLENGELLDAAQVFSRFYMGEPHLTLQTCIQKNGDANWGRLFIVAHPIYTEYTN